MINPKTVHQKHRPGAHVATLMALELHLLASDCMNLPALLMVAMAGSSSWMLSQQKLLEGISSHGPGKVRSGKGGFAPKGTLLPA